MLKLVIDTNLWLRTLMGGPTFCRAPKDNPVLAAAIDGSADAIVSGDADLRADSHLRAAMAKLGVELWGVETLRAKLEQSTES